MENFTSNTNKPDLHSNNTNDLSFMEEEYISDFGSMDNNQYVSLNNINEGWDDIITEKDIFEDSNIDLNNKEFTDNPNFFQLNMNAFQSARYFSTITDNIDDNILELDSNFDDESVISMETNITNEIKLFEISEPTKSTKFTTCVLIDNFNGEIRSCGSSQNLHCIKNIFGTWEIDSEMVCKVNDDLASLGVCYSHQMYDQTKLHVKNAKGTKNSSLGFISNRRCLFCNINKTFYTRGEQCDQHSWTLVGRDLQVPCGGQYYCTSLTEIQPILYPSLSNKKSRYVCTSCYEKYGGHFHQRSGIKGKASLNCQKDSSHKNDAIESLHLIANWLLYVAKYESSNFQEQLSQEVINLLLFLPSSQKINHTSSTSISKESKPLNIIPSPFIIKAAFKLNKLDFFNYENKEFNEQESYEFGQGMAKIILKNRKNINNNKNLFENPNSLIEHHNIFPSLLSNFFGGLINTLQLSKFKEVNRKKQFYNKPTTAFDPNSTIKTRIFLMSIIFRIAFPGLHLWLPTMLASLIRKPKFTTQLHQLLTTIHAVTHTQRHERKLENIRISAVNPCERLWIGDNIWNIGVIDNIDFKEKTFAYSNIFDQTRNTTHATLRMVFQYKMPTSLSTLLSNILPISDISTLKLWGENIKAQQFISDFHQVFKDFLQFSNLENTFIYSQDFDLPNIHQQIINSVELGCQLPPANIVILEAGNKPSSNEGIFEACDMFLQDFNLNNNKYIDIVSDEAIFRRTKLYLENHMHTRIILGQWHTSKDMCSVLITIFSGFGIFNLAAALGTKFLDKLEAIVDYRSTCRVLEMIWFVVGVALHIHLKKYNKTIEQIMNEDNNLLKTWYLYFKWAGWWKAHRIGIRMGNFEMQHESLSAFAPLFPVAGKLNYASSVTFYLAHLTKHPELKELLKHACSINISREKHFFAFDEALETFGVKYIKQNISGNPINTEQLKNQIKAVQSERDRINLFLFEFLDDNVTYKGDRAVKSRKEITWDVINQLIIAFDNPMDNSIFKDISGLYNMTAECTFEGWTRLFNCYSIGEERLYAILKQDVLKSEKRIATGRRAKNIGHHTIANMKKSNNNTRDRVQNREREQHLLSSNIFTTQSLNSNTIVFNESQHSFSMPSNSNNSFNQNINNLNNNLQNIQLSSHTEIQNLSNIQAIHSPSGPVENPRPTKRIKRTTHMQELSFLEPLVNNTSEENISNAIQQLNSWNIENNHTENMWNRQRVIKWVQTRTRNDRLKEKQEQNH